MEKTNHLYSGKTKTVFNTTDPDKAVLFFRDDATAFNNQKSSILHEKGMVNNKFNAFIMQHLNENGIQTHFVKLLSSCESLVIKLAMLPLECVVRNIASGSICNRLGIKNGTEFNPPVFEFFYKDDELGDPLVNRSHIATMGWVEAKWLDEMQQISLVVNEKLKLLFAQAGITLVDFKLEFGLKDNRLILGDEFTPDGCRLWDVETQHPLDKDRFRHGLGDVIESYIKAGNKLGIEF